MEKDKKSCPKKCREFLIFKKEVDVTFKDFNASKRLFIAEHLVNNSTCAKSYNK